MPALIRAAVTRTYGAERDTDADPRVIATASGAWSAHPDDGADFVDSLRSGRRPAAGGA